MIRMFDSILNATRRAPGTNRRNVWQSSVLLFGLLCLASGLTQASTCMQCHNGTDQNDYSGNGIVNPHPFAPVDNLACVICHGGDNTGETREAAHVPVPPLLRANQNDPNLSADQLANNAEAYFNRLTQAGLDKEEAYEFNGQTYTGLDYLQFISPGDLRVVTEGLSCGTVGCHNNHAAATAANPLSTTAPFFSGTRFSAGVNDDEGNSSYSNTVAQYGYRAIVDTDFDESLVGLVNSPRLTGKVGVLEEVPSFAEFNNDDQHELWEDLPADIMQFFLSNDPEHQNSILPGSPLYQAWNEQVTITCGDCHANSAGANNRAGDFRNTGCAQCHMEASFDGIGRSQDPFVGLGQNVNSGLNVATVETIELQHDVLPNADYEGLIDTFIDENNPNSNFAADDLLRVDGDTTTQGDDLRTLLRFNLDPIPEDAQILSVSMTINVENASTEDYFMTPLIQNFAGGQATWNNRNNNNQWDSAGADGNDDQTNDIMGVIQADDFGSHTVEFTDEGVEVVQGWVDGSFDNDGFIISNTNAFDGLAFTSRNANDRTLGPKLSVTFSSNSGGAGAKSNFIGVINDVDNIAAPELPGIASHQIRSVARTLDDGTELQGVNDHSCAGCHQGSNRTALQYWGMRLDQNATLVNNTQYPANPDNFENAANNQMVFPDEYNNNTFNGRNADQLIEIEDYDGDGRDDTPPDIHHEVGLGCIDCHGSRDVHGPNLAPNANEVPGIPSRQGQHTKVQCQSCHGSVESTAQSVQCVNYEDEETNCAQDLAGLPMRNVEIDAAGDVWLTSRLTGNLHYIPQTQDVVVNNNKVNPLTGEALYNEKASFAMGTADGNADTGLGPIQAIAANVSEGFNHNDTLDCASCHASWTNTCKGCHLATAFDDNNEFFSNITGERIVLKQEIADFGYQTPVWYELGVTSRGVVSNFGGGMKVFYSHFDANGNQSDWLAFSDNNGNGNNPGVDGRNEFPALGHDQVAAHSIRGAPTNDNEGARGCVNCHLTTQSIDNFGDEYREFIDAMNNNDFEELDFDLLQEHIGQNTGNHLNSPFWIHKVMGLGSGLLLFNEDGCPVNPLDNDPNRSGCDGDIPSELWQQHLQTGDVVKYNLDRVVEWSGVSNVSCSNPMLSGTASTKRDGAQNPEMCGPLGETLLRKMADPDEGLVLDAWIDADGDFGGTAATIINQAIQQQQLQQQQQQSILQLQDEEKEDESGAQLIVPLSLPATLPTQTRPLPTPDQASNYKR